MDLGLTGKAAIVTGASMGIGKDIALGLAREGADVAIAARGMDRLKATAEELAKATGRRIVPVQCDTGSLESIQGMVKTAAAALGRIDILVNNAAGAAINRPATGEDQGENLFANMSVKVLGYLRCAHEVVPHMRKQGRGRIVNVSGMAARVPGNIVRSIRNISVVALTKNLADELGPQGIYVTGAHPGFTLGEKTQQSLNNPAAVESLLLHFSGYAESVPSPMKELFAKLTKEEAERWLKSRMSIQRFVTNPEFADIIVFLCSPRSIAINGDFIPAGGGMVGSMYY